jgi:hypothetical protein
VDVPLEGNCPKDGNCILKWYAIPMKQVGHLNKISPFRGMVCSRIINEQMILEAMTAMEISEVHSQ